MTLALEIEFLSGTAFIARGPDSDAPDWPPQPDRVFSALVATWGSRANHREDDAEANALRWLEKLPATPLIIASASEPRTAPNVYVPPNDPKSGRSGDLKVLPGLRRRQPRRFPASHPHNSVVRYYWDAVSPDSATLDALEGLAADTSYVGHSSSLTRCRFFSCAEMPASDSQMPIRRVYEGRFKELRGDYERFVRSNGKSGRPRPGDPVIARPELAVLPIHSCFSSEWLVLELSGGKIPDIRAAALLAKEIRDTLLSGFNQSGMADRIPTVVSGHRDDGSPSPDPHMAIVPLAFAGFPFADGRVLGFALVPPCGSEIFQDSAFRRAMRKIAPYDEESGRSSLRLRYFELRLSPTLTPAKTSLDPARYSQPSRVWATMTPIVLDRHLKKSGAERIEEIEEQVRAGCRNIGLPEPDLIVPDKHPAIEGVPSAYPSGRAPSWMRWRLPSSLASRQLTHAVIQFPEPVRGPVILGAGRFVGMGLCLPMQLREERA